VRPRKATHTEKSGTGPGRVFLGRCFIVEKGGRGVHLSAPITLSLCLCPGLENSDTIDNNFKLTKWFLS
jgi:hypothetical protein